MSLTKFDEQSAYKWPSMIDSIVFWPFQITTVSRHCFFGSPFSSTEPWTRKKIQCGFQIYDKRLKGKELLMCPAYFKTIATAVRKSSLNTIPSRDHVAVYWKQSMTLYFYKCYRCLSGVFQKYLFYLPIIFRIQSSYPDVRYHVNNENSIARHQWSIVVHSVKIDS